TIHGIFDFRYRWLSLFAEKCCSGHDLPGLTVATLRDVDFVPRGLQWVISISRKALDCRDSTLTNGRHREGTRPDSISVHVNGAGTALRDTTSVFRSDEAEIVPKDPEQRRVRLNINGMRLTVYQ